MKLKALGHLFLSGQVTSVFLFFTFFFFLFLSSPESQYSSRNFPHSSAVGFLLYIFACKYLHKPDWTGCSCNCSCCLFFNLRSFFLQRLDSRPNYVIINNILQVQGPCFFSQSPWYINLIVIPPFSRIQIIIHLCLCDESASSQIVEQVIRVVEYNANNSQGQTYG